MGKSIVANRKRRKGISKHTVPSGDDAKAPSGVDAKADLHGLIRLTFWRQTSEEVLAGKPSPRLEAFFLDLGFSPLVAKEISTAIARQFLQLLPKKRGRRWPSMRPIERQDG
jgi:hypothetical protein